MSTQTLRYWPVGTPIPAGWTDEGPLPGNHGRYSRLISRPGDGTPPSVVAIEHERGAALTGSFQGQTFTVPISIAYAAQLAGELLLIVRTHLHRNGGPS